MRDHFLPPLPRKQAKKDRRKWEAHLREHDRTGGCGFYSCPTNVRLRKRYYKTLSELKARKDPNRGRGGRP